MKFLVTTTLLLTLLGAMDASATTPPAHTETVHAEAEPNLHEPLPESESLTLTGVVDAALVRHQDRGLLSAQSDYATAWHKQSRSLVSGTPAFSQRYQSDRWQDDNGLEEFESGLSLPLWHLGERRNARALGAALAANADAAGRELRWRLAGDLRTLLWGMAKARQRLAMTQDALEQSRELERAVARQVELGDLPRAHLGPAGIEVLEATSAVTHSRADLVDLQVEYRVLTGLDVIPASLAEPPAETTPTTHPYLEAAHTALERVERESRAHAYKARGTPNLLIGPRWEQARRDEITEESIGVTLTVPIPVGSSARLAESAAALAVAEAQRELDARRRTQQLALHEAEHRLAVARSTAAEAHAAADLATRHETAMQKAFEAGEIEFAEYLRVRRMGREFRLEAELARLEVEAAAALHNQALGVTP